MRRLNQLGYFKPLEGKEGELDVTADAGRRQQGRRQDQVRGAEPQPARVRRRRVAVRRLLRPALVPDLELPRPRRDAGRLAAEGLAGAAVSGLVLASRICSIGRSPRASTSSPGSTSSRCSTRRRRPAATWSSGFRSRGYTRLFTGYSYERIKVLRHQPAVPRSGGPRREPVPARVAAARPGRPAHRQQDFAERGVQHGQPADLPDERASDCTGSARLRRRRREHQLHPDPARGHLVPAR